jgi:hypothetical protein
MTQTSRNIAVQRDTELANLHAAAQQDAGFEKVLKFKKGDYSIADEPVALGTEYLAHTKAWTKCWIKPTNGEVSQRKMYRVALGETPPEREDLDDLDLIGEKDNDGMSADPWVFQYLLPLKMWRVAKSWFFAPRRSAVGAPSPIYARPTPSAPKKPDAASQSCVWRQR